MLFCEQSKWRNWIIILLKKRIPSRYLKILSKCTVKKTKNDWQRFETICLRESKSFNKLYDNKHTYTWLSWQVAFCSVFFFFQRPVKERWNQLWFRQFPVFKRHPVSQRQENSYSALSFWPNKLFQHDAFAFWCYFQWKAVVMCYCLHEPIKLPFLTPVKWLSSHLSRTCFCSP